MSSMSKSMGPIGTIIGAIATIYSGGSAAAVMAASAAGGAAGQLAGNALAKAAPLPPTPNILSMPDLSQVQATQQQSIAAQLGRAGRASTILTPTADSNKLSGN
jgi:hypothetical protein